MLKFSCEKALLQQAVSAASRAVASKSSIPALEGILMEGDMNLTLSGYNMQTGIRTAIEAQIHEAGRIVLNAKLFGDIIRKMPDDVIVFSADEKMLVHLSCGDASFDILGLSADDYPELPEVDDQFSVALEQRTLKAMVSQTAFAVSTNESRPVHTGSLFEIDDRGLTMVSVDGFRLALRREPLERIDGGAFRFVAPGSALREVENICSDTDELITVTQGKRHLLFEAGSTQLICRRLVFAVGNSHLAALKSRLLQVRHNRIQRFCFSAAFVKRLQHAVVACLAHNSDAQNTCNLCDSGRNSAVSREIFQRFKHK